MLCDSVRGNTNFSCKVDFEEFSVSHSLEIMGININLIYHGCGGESDTVGCARDFISCCWEVFCANIDEKYKFQVNSIE